MLVGHVKNCFKSTADLVRNRGNSQMSKMTGKHESREVIKHEPDSRKVASANLLCIRVLGCNGHQAWQTEKKAHARRK